MLIILDSITKVFYYAGIEQLDIGIDFLFFCIHLLIPKYGSSIENLAELLDHKKFIEYNDEILLKIAENLKSVKLHCLIVSMRVTLKLMNRKVRCLH